MTTKQNGKRPIKYYTLVNQWGKYRAMAVTSRGSRRVNGHFCDAPDVGTHTTKNCCVGEFDTAVAALEAQERVQAAKNHYRAKAKPFENEVSRLYALQIAEMERAATNADWTPIE